MKFLLYNYFLDLESNYSNKYKILCILHELRIVSKQQLLDFFNIDSHITSTNLHNHLKGLKNEELIGVATDKTKIGNPKYYFLTKEGHNSIGGYYTLPKIPEYNLQHHLQINDYIIQMLKLAGDHPHLKLVMSERRQVFETKDFTNKRNGKNILWLILFFVSEVKKIMRSIGLSKLN